MSDNRIAILAELEPLFDQAKRENKWFNCSYPDLWFSPEELRLEHKEGNFIWGAVNWKLRDPEYIIKQAEEKVLNAQQELESIKARVRKWQTS